MKQFSVALYEQVLIGLVLSFIQEVCLFWVNPNPNIAKQGYNVALHL